MLPSFLQRFFIVLLVSLFFDSALPVEKTKCPETFLGACNLDATVICVYLRNGRYYQTQSNACIVCKNKSVIETSLGACPSAE